MNLRQKAKRLKQENERLRGQNPKNIVVTGNDMRIIPVKATRFCGEAEMARFEYVKTKMLNDLLNECSELVEFETEPEHDITWYPIISKVTATLYVAVKKYDGGKIKC